MRWITPPRVVASALAGLVLAACGDGEKASVGPDPCETFAPLALGQTVSAALATTDCRLDDQSFADLYRLTLPADTVVRIDLRSTAFDAYLALFDGNRQLIEVSDDVGGSSDARIVRALAAGTYLVVANSYDGGSTGPYTLTVAGSNALGCLTTVPVAVGDSVAGGLAAGDCELPDGRLADAYTLDLSAATALSIRLASTDFDAFLVVRDSLAPLYSDGDGGGGSDAQLRITLSPGRYAILATSSGPGGIGRYAFTVRTQ